MGKVSKVSATSKPIQHPIQPFLGLDLDMRVFSQKPHKLNELACG
jgi:hypothetical protein